MPTFRTLFVVIATLVAAELAGSSQHGLAVPALWTLALVGSVLCFAKLQAVYAREQAARNEEEGAYRYFTFCERLNAWWGWSYPLAMSATGLVASGASLRADGWYTLGAAVMFLPHLIYLVMIELVTAQFETNSASDCSQRWLLRLRLGELASTLVCLGPMLVIGLCCDLAQGIPALALDSGAFHPALQLVLQVALGGCVMLAVALGYPLFFGYWTGVQPIGEPLLKQRIEKLMELVGVAACRIREVPSHGSWRSAAIVGWLPQTRQIWLGDALLDDLDEQELDLVLLHELAHIKLYHFAYRILPVVWALIGGATVLVAAEEVLASTWGAAAIATLVAGMCLLLGMSIVSKSLEFEADSLACMLAEQHCDWCREGAWQAEQRLISALTKTTPVACHETPTWMHPSLRERVSHLASQRAEKVQKRDW